MPDSASLLNHFMVASQFFLVQHRAYCCYSICLLKYGSLNLVCTSIQWFDERFRPEDNPILLCTIHDKPNIFCCLAIESSVKVFLIFCDVLVILNKFECADIFNFPMQVFVFLCVLFICFSKEVAVKSTWTGVVSVILFYNNGLSQQKEYTRY